MEEQKNQGRIWKMVLIFTVLVVFPAVSWIYLKGGLTWRREAISELGQYGKVREAWAVLENSERVNLLEKKVCVIHIFGDKPTLTDANRQIFETYSELANQFGTTDDFRVVSLWDGGGAQDFNDFYNQKKLPNEGTWLRSGGLGSWRTIMVNQYENYRLKTKATEVPEYFALSDTSGTIRRFYNALDKSEVERMIQHIAILLPTQK